MRPVLPIRPVLRHSLDTDAVVSLELVQGMKAGARLAEATWHALIEDVHGVCLDAGTSGG